MNFRIYLAYSIFLEKLLQPVIKLVVTYCVGLIAPEIVSSWNGEHSTVLLSLCMHERKIFASQMGSCMVLSSDLCLFACCLGSQKDTRTSTIDVTDHRVFIQVFVCNSVIGWCEKYLWLPASVILLIKKNGFFYKFKKLLRKNPGCR